MSSGLARWRRSYANHYRGTMQLVDSLGRIATDLRVSLTDKCNLRCTYCLPSEGIEWIPHSQLLTDDEVTRLIKIGVQLLGITEVRFTGGEPLLRPGLCDIIAATSSLVDPPQTSLTTNGIGLHRVADQSVLCWSVTDQRISGHPECRAIPGARKT